MPDEKSGVRVEAVDLEWKDHGQMLTSVLWNFFKEDHLVDMNLTCYGRRFRVHTLILEAFLPVLKESLAALRKHNECVLGRNDDVHLHFDDGHADDIDYLMEFVYTGKVTQIPREHLGCLMVIAEDMGLQALVKVIQEQTEENFSEVATKTNLALSCGEERHSSDDVSTSTGPQVDPSSISLVETAGTEFGEAERMLTMLLSQDMIMDSVENPPKPTNVVASPVQKRKQQLPKRALGMSHEGNQLVGAEEDYASGQPSANYTLKTFGGNRHKKQPTKREQQHRHHQDSLEKSVDQGDVFPVDVTAQESGSERLLKRGRPKKARTDDSSPLCNEEGEYGCEHCSHRTPRRNGLIQHLAAAHKLDMAGNRLTDITCSQCDYVCVSKYQLKRHMMRKHTEDKPYKCSLCSYSAVYSSDFNKHVRIRHQHRRDYMCEECGYQSQTSGGLNKHVRAIHEGRKQFQCDQCAAQYADSVSFKLHKQGHAGSVVNEYVCHICAHSCPRRNQLRSHLRKKHMIEMESSRPKYRSFDTDAACDVASLVVISELAEHDVADGVV